MPKSRENTVIIMLCGGRQNKLDTMFAVIAFSRNEGTHPNLVSQASQAREIEIFVDCKLAAPLGFCPGHWASF